MKEGIKNIFPGLVAWRNRLYNYLAHRRFRNLSAEEVFQTIYKENHWKDAESKSGTGSNRRNSSTVVQIVNDAISKLSVQSILDIPCGDFNWMKNVDLSNVVYTGADIVDEIIQSNTTQFAQSNINFKKLNLLADPLPTVDLIFCRDCLVHLSFQDIQRAFLTIKQSGSKYLMATTFPQHKNHDIITGDWRPVNLERPPIEIGPPVYIVSEMFDEDKRYSDKSLAVWRVSDL